MESCIKVHIGKVQFVIYSQFSSIGKYESIIPSCSQSPSVFVGRQLLTEYPVSLNCPIVNFYFINSVKVAVLCVQCIYLQKFFIILIFINLFGFLIVFSYFLILFCLLLIILLIINLSFDVLKLMNNWIKQSQIDVKPFSFLPHPSPSQLFMIFRMGLIICQKHFTNFILSHMNHDKIDGRIKEQNLRF